MMATAAPASSTNPLRRLPHSSVPQSGFLSSSLTLALILVIVLAVYVVFQRRSFLAGRRHAERVRAQLGEEVHLLDGVAYHISGFRWQPGARCFLLGVAILVFAINIFSIVASVVSEPILREPKFWLIKVQAIPLATIALLVQLFMKPTKETPTQINHTLVLLLALILLVLAPILTSIPLDADHGRLSLARKILEHIICPAALMGGLVAVHRVVFEQLDNAVTQPPSPEYTDDDDYLDEGEEDGYVYEDDEEDESAEGVDSKDADGEAVVAEVRYEVPPGEERADHLKATETQ